MMQKIDWSILTVMSVIPGGCTKILQPLDVFINKQFNEYFLIEFILIKGKFQSKKFALK